MKGPESTQPVRPVRLEREAPASAWIAQLMDVAFVIPGTKIRFGLDSLIGLFPGVGDSIGALISSVIIAQGAQLGVPKIILARMGVNVLINTVVGFVPVFGDVFSVFFRSNMRNYDLLRRYSGQRKATGRDWLFVIGGLALLLAVLVALFIGALWVIKRIVEWL